jgi:cellobionic acid phosphorylase
MYRILVECLFGLKGDPDGLRIEPNLPSHWKQATAARRFRGSTFDVEFTRDSNASEMRVMLDDKIISGNVVRNPLPDQHYRVQVVLPG